MKHVNYYEIIYDPNGAYVAVELTQGKFGIFDINDWFDKAYEITWHTKKNKKINRFGEREGWYVRGATGGRKDRTYFLAHRFIFGLTAEDPDVDHIDRNGLNNKRSNLRLDTNKQNNQNVNLRSSNSTGFIGVCLINKKSKPKYMAYISVNKKRKYLYYFPFTEEGKRKAALAYDEAALKYHGEFAVTNESLGLI
jgi:hypothetical protein